MDFRPHTATLFIPYVDSNEIKYAKEEIVCKFTPRDAVSLGRVEVQGSSNAKLIVFNEDLEMTNYVEPDSWAGTGFTFIPETVVVLGSHDMIDNVTELDSRYTVKSVYKNDYSFVLGHHFVLELV